MTQIRRANRVGSEEISDDAATILCLPSQITGRRKLDVVRQPDTALQEPALVAIRLWSVKQNRKFTWIILSEKSDKKVTQFV